jgi:Tfp pilus assembly protein PilV
MMRRAGTRKVQADSGFSLTEVVFAMAFLGVGLLAVAQMIPLATHQIVSSKTMTDAVAAGQTKMEELKMEDFMSAALNAGSYADTSGVYARAWTIVNDTPVTGSKRVDLTVSWITSSGTQTTRMTTFVTR